MVESLTQLINEALSCFVSGAASEEDTRKLTGKVSQAFQRTLPKEKGETEKTNEESNSLDNSVSSNPFQIVRETFLLL